MWGHLPLEEAEPLAREWKGTMMYFFHNKNKSFLFFRRVEIMLFCRCIVVFSGERSPQNLDQNNEMADGMP